MAQDKGKPQKPIVDIDDKVPVLEDKKPVIKSQGNTK